MRFLFERLDPAPFELKAAVQAQLERIVTARSYGVDAFAQEFGMPSVVELGAAERPALSAYAARLARMVARYEPRLRGAQVVVEGGGGPLSPFLLVVTGALGEQDEAQRFAFPLAAGGGQ
jgi:predicted component of type VI protein secretion system